MVLAAWFVKLVRWKRRTDWTCGTAELEMDGRSTHLSACVDSGNSLTDPISGRPVILIDKAGAKKLPFRKEEYPQRYAAVPYHSVGVEQGILEGLRIDRISYEGKDYHNVILAYCEGTFGEFEVLLNRNILEGGVAEDDSYTCGRPEKPGGAILQETAGDAEKKRTGRFILHRR
jgi:stage II sporulation protein GA (sporulation sigma-E factor processing peptidase)